MADAQCATDDEIRFICLRRSTHTIGFVPIEITFDRNQLDSLILTRSCQSIRLEFRIECERFCSFSVRFYRSSEWILVTLRAIIYFINVSCIPFNRMRTLCCVPAYAIYTHRHMVCLWTCIVSVYLVSNRKISFYGTSSCMVYGHIEWEHSTHKHNDTHRIVRWKCNMKKGGRRRHRCCCTTNIRRMPVGVLRGAKFCVCVFPYVRTTANTPQFAIMSVRHGYETFENGRERERDGEKGARWPLQMKKKRK